MFGNSFNYGNFCFYVYWLIYYLSIIRVFIFFNIKYEHSISLITQYVNKYKY